jgi:para-nitrobenzyl esterase
VGPALVALTRSPIPMSTRRAVVLLSALALVAAAARALQPRQVDVGEVVRVDAGALRGVVRDGIAAFRGIPYAAPPVGALRWRAPQPVAPWRGERAAATVGPICLQQYNARDKGVGPLPASEDCLTLNVWAPAGPRTAPLPVLFWIHGGGFVNGSGTAALYDGTHLARQGAVVVTINYRLGRFGFFAHPALTRENADGGMLGNYALMDQIAALRWVRRNAAAFGGDAGNVTIFGESAGGASVTRLMISPLARGLFHKAIAQSGLGRDRSALIDRPNAAYPVSAQEAGRRFADSLGVRGDDAAARRALRALPAERILAAGEPGLFDLGFPAIDGRLLTTDVVDAFARGAQARVPFLLGYNSAEFPWATEGSPFFANLVRFTPAERARADAAYGGKQELSTHLVSDLLFVEPARELARLHARAGHPAYLYRFSVLPPTAPKELKGAPHASERQYVFRTLDQAEWPVGEADAAAAAAMSAYWVAFARGGDPNGAGRPPWPAFTAARDTLLEFTNAGPVARRVPFAERLDVITAHHAARRAAPR